MTLSKDFRASAKKIQQSDKYPFYKWCCENVKGYKTVDGNIQFRLKVLEECARSQEAREDYYIMCSRDILFYVNTFVWTYDPRLLPNSPNIPFVTYDYQDVSIDETMIAVWEGHDLLLEKSRDMGASWILGITDDHCWRFSIGYSSLLGSRNETYVDNPIDPKSLFWKIDFIRDNLPGWMNPDFKRVYLHLQNKDNGSTISGESTTGDFARGGRWTKIGLDEFAAVEPDGAKVESATRDATRCRIYNSTHQGANTAFYRKSLTSIRKLQLHWSLHPEKSRGMYYSINRKVVLVDSDFHGTVELHNGDKVMFPDEYPFVLDDKLRSPFYDVECERSSHPMEIAQELDMDPHASDFQFFHGPMIAEIEDRDVRPPLLEGMLDFDEDSLDSLGFAPGKNGPLKLWINPDVYGKLPEDLDVIAGCDVSAGTGASNTTMSFVNKPTGEKIAEYCNPWIMPEAFAKTATALCRWFNNAYLIFDGGGSTGRIFGDTIIGLYRNIYYRRNEEGYRKKVSDKPGVFLNPKEKGATLGQYRRSLKDKTFVQRSSSANQECLCYIHKGQTIEHTRAVNSIDPSGAGANHGDLVISDALAAKGLYLFGINKLKTEPNTSKPVNCVASRREQYERDLKKEEEW